MGQEDGDAVTFHNTDAASRNFLIPLRFFPIMMERLRRITVNIYRMLTQHFSGKILLYSNSKPLRKLLSKPPFNTQDEGGSGQSLCLT